MVETIKSYRQMNGTDILKVFCKPTKNFPEGSNYFYVDADAEDLVSNYCWGLKAHSSGIIDVLASIGNKHKGTQHTLQLHREIAKKYLGYDFAGLIDHINLLDFDNTDSNLNVVLQNQNMYNVFCRGYIPKERGIGIAFVPAIRIDKKRYTPYGWSIRREDEACRLQHIVDTEWLQEQLGSDVYHFDILEYRRGSEEILDLERTGKISHEEASYRHILKYADNAWYYYRYGLEAFFKEHHIPVPEYRLDVAGFMSDKITGKKLCPFYKE